MLLLCFPLLSITFMTLYFVITPNTMKYTNLPTWGRSKTLLHLALEGERMRWDHSLFCNCTAALWVKVILFQDWWRKDQKTGGGIGVLVIGVPCLHLQYFTPHLLLISYSYLQLSFRPHYPKLRCPFMCVCTSQALFRMSERSFNESILVNSISTAQIYRKEQ